MRDNSVHFSKVENDIYIANHFLTSAETQQYIQISEGHGYKPADVDVNGERQMLTIIRDNDRVDLQSTQIAESLWRRIDRASLPLVDNLSASGLTPYLRFYRYQGNQKFQLHKDGSKEYQGCKSYLTLLIYLNDLPDAGATRFRESKLLVYPEAGKALLFKHDLWHAGLPVEDGIKYVLRTDMLFSS